MTLLLPNAAVVVFVAFVGRTRIFEAGICVGGVFQDYVNQLDLQTISRMVFCGVPSEEPDGDKSGHCETIRRRVAQIPVTTAIQLACKLTAVPIADAPDGLQRNAALAMTNKAVILAALDQLLGVPEAEVHIIVDDREPEADSIPAAENVSRQ